MSKHFIYIQSHPIQYNAPLFAAITSEKIKMDVLFLSDEGTKETFDVQFGTKIKWDIPLLTGYNYEFIKNNAVRPSIHNGFFGLINLGLIKRLRESPKSIVIVPGWNYFSYWIAILASKYYGHNLAIRCESPLNQEFLKMSIYRKLRVFLLKTMILSRIDFAFYIGKQNYDFYKYYGVSDKKLYFLPYAVDNSRFQNSRDKLKSKKIDLRSEIAIDEKSIVILYSGKLISKKRPMDLLYAFLKLTNVYEVQLIFMGDGELRSEMEYFIHNNNLSDRVKLTGFVNQTEIVKYYALSDIFVMSSGIGETWGLSVNEALNFNLKLVVSDLTGSSVDLVSLNKTGWIFETGNIEDLTEKLVSAIKSQKFDEKDYQNLLEKFSFDTTILNLKKVSMS